MNLEDSEQYYIENSEHYLIPKEVFIELFNEMKFWREKNHFFKEINKEEAKNLKEGTIYYLYNPTTSSELRTEKASKRDIAHNKYALKELRYYIKEKV